MAAMVLNSPRAVEMSVHVVRAFGRLRQMLATHKELAQKLAELELRLEGHDKAIHNLFETKLLSKLQRVTSNGSWGGCAWGPRHDNSKGLG